MIHREGAEAANFRRGVDHLRRPAGGHDEGASGQGLGGSLVDDGMGRGGLADGFRVGSDGVFVYGNGFDFTIVQIRFPDNDGVCSKNNGEDSDTV
jgi:hypothetical protein